MEKEENKANGETMDTNGMQRVSREGVDLRERVFFASFDCFSCKTKSSRSIRSVTRSDHGHRVDPREIDQLAEDLQRLAKQRGDRRYLISDYFIHLHFKN